MSEQEKKDYLNDDEELISENENIRISIPRSK